MDLATILGGVFADLLRLQSAAVSAVPTPSAPPLVSEPTPAPEPASPVAVAPEPEKVTAHCPAVGLIMGSALATEFVATWVSKVTNAWE